MAPLPLDMSVFSCTKLKGVGLWVVKGDNLEITLSSAVKDSRLGSVLLPGCVNLGQVA